MIKLNDDFTMGNFLKGRILQQKVTSPVQQEKQLVEQFDYDLPTLSIKKSKTFIPSKDRKNVVTPKPLSHTTVESPKQIL